MKLFHKLELIGTFLILISVAWQFFIDRQHDGILTDWQFEHIETILDEIHTRQSELQKNQNAIAQQLATGDERPISLFVDNYEYATSHKGGSAELKERAEGFKVFGVVVFLLGSALLLVGKVIEYSGKNA